MGSYVLVSVKLSYKTYKTFSCLDLCHSIMTDEAVERMIQRRVERDTNELQKLIATHFEQRQSEDTDFETFTGNLDKRRDRREQEQADRAEKERARQDAIDAEHKRKQDEEEARKQENKDFNSASMVPDFEKYKRTEEKKANAWTTKVSALFVKMNQNVM